MTATRATAALLGLLHSVKAAPGNAWRTRRPAPRTPPGAPAAAFTRRLSPLAPLHGCSATHLATLLRCSDRYDQAGASSGQGQPRTACGPRPGCQGAPCDQPVLACTPLGVLRGCSRQHMGRAGSTGGSSWGGIPCVAAAAARHASPAGPTPSPRRRLTAAAAPLLSSRPPLFYCRA